MLSTFSSTMPILCWYQASTGIIRENVKNTAHSSWYWYCTFFGTVHSLQIFMQSNITAKIHLMACILGACILQLTFPATERHVVKFHDITASQCIMLKKCVYVCYCPIKISANKGVNQHSKDIRRTQHQRPESPTVTLTWHASTYQVLNSTKCTSNQNSIPFNLLSVFIF